LLKIGKAMIKSNFREWTSDRIDETFGTKQIHTHPVLDSWLAFEYELEGWEKKALDRVQSPLIIGAIGWNETELENKFISPMFMLAGVYGDNFGYFLERDLAATIDDYELSGRVDGLVASGVRNPKKPFFCLNEYKRLTDPDGEPQGQVLMAMLVAQHHNNTPTVPLHGCYIVGKDWYFMILVGKEYAISKIFTADDEGIYDIFRILKGLTASVAAQLE
jgi:hypothetical protein